MTTDGAIQCEAAGPEHELRDRLRREFEHSEEPTRTVTRRDVYYCYRLLLEREPDAAGLAYWAEVIASEGVSLETLVERFLQSAERKSLESARMQPELVDLEGFAIWVRRADPQIGTAIARDRSYEPHLTGKIRSLLAPGNTFIDVGANVGYFALLAASLVGPRGRVIAFEPRADNVALLRRSVEQNGFGNVDIRECAVAERAQTLSYLASGAWNSNGRVVGDHEAGRELLPTVRAVTLDAELARIDHIDVIKMDIEGAEPRALEGMRKLLERHRPVVFTEFSPSLIRLTGNVEPEAFLAALSAGHTLSVLPHDATPERGPLAPREILEAHAASGLTHLDLVAYPL